MKTERDKILSSRPYGTEGQEGFNFQGERAYKHVNKGQVVRGRNFQIKDTVVINKTQSPGNRRWG